MTVKELIQKLSLYEDDLEVLLYDNEYDRYETLDAVEFRVECDGDDCGLVIR